MDSIFIGTHTAEGFVDKTENANVLKRVWIQLPHRKRTKYTQVIVQQQLCNIIWIGLAM